MAPVFRVGSYAVPAILFLIAISTAVYAAAAQGISISAPALPDIGGILISAPAAVLLDIGGLSMCFPFFLILALLFAALYAQGKSPLAFLDLSSPRPRTPQRYRFRTFHFGIGARQMIKELKAIGGGVLSRTAAGLTQRGSRYVQLGNGQRLKAWGSGRGNVTGPDGKVVGKIDMNAKIRDANGRLLTVAQAYRLAWKASLVENKRGITEMNSKQLFTKYGITGMSSKEFAASLKAQGMTKAQINKELAKRKITEAQLNKELAKMRITKGDAKVLAKAAALPAVIEGGRTGAMKLRGVEKVAAVGGGELGLNKRLQYGQVGKVESLTSRYQLWKIERERAKLELHTGAALGVKGKTIDEITAKAQAAQQAGEKLKARQLMDYASKMDTLNKRSEVRTLAASMGKNTQLTPSTLESLKHNHMVMNQLRLNLEKTTSIYPLGTAMKQTRSAFAGAILFPMQTVRYAAAARKLDRALYNPVVRTKLYGAYYKEVDTDAKKVSAQHDSTAKNIEATLVPLRRAMATNVEAELGKRKQLGFKNAQEVQGHLKTLTDSQKKDFAMKYPELNSQLKQYEAHSSLKALQNHMNGMTNEQRKEFAAKNPDLNAHVKRYEGLNAQHQDLDRKRADLRTLRNEALSEMVRKGLPENYLELSRKERLKYSGTTAKMSLSATYNGIKNRVNTAGIVKWSPEASKTEKTDMKLRTWVGEHQANADKHEAKILELRKLKDSQSAEKTRLEGEIKGVQDKKGGLEKEAASIRQSMADTEAAMKAERTEARRKEMQAQLKDTQNSLKGVDAELRKANSQLKELGFDYKDASKTGRWEDRAFWRSTEDKLEKETARLRKDQVKLTRAAEEYKMFGMLDSSGKVVTGARLASDLTYAKGKVEVADSDVKRLRSEISELEANLKDTSLSKVKRDSLEGELKSKEGRLEKRAGELAQLNDELKTKDAASEKWREERKFVGLNAGETKARIAGLEASEKKLGMQKDALTTEYDALTLLAEIERKVAAGEPVAKEVATVAKLREQSRNVKELIKDNTLLAEIEKKVAAGESITKDVAAVAKLREQAHTMEELINNNRAAYDATKSYLAVAEADLKEHQLHFDAMTRRERWTAGDGSSWIDKYRDRQFDKEMKSLEKTFDTRQPIPKDYLNGMDPLLLEAAVRGAFKFQQPDADAKAQGISSRFNSWLWDQQKASTDAVSIMVTAETVHNLNQVKILEMEHQRKNYFAKMGEAQQAHEEAKQAAQTRSQDWAEVQVQQEALTQMKKLRDIMNPDITDPDSAVEKLRTLRTGVEARRAQQQTRLAELSTMLETNEVKANKAIVEDMLQATQKQLAILEEYTPIATKTGNEKERWKIVGAWSKEIAETETGVVDYREKVKSDIDAASNAAETWGVEKKRLEDQLKRVEGELHVRAREMEIEQYQVHLGMLERAQIGLDDAQAVLKPLQDKKAQGPLTPAEETKWGELTFQIAQAEATMAGSGEAINALPMDLRTEAQARTDAIDEEKRDKAVFDAINRGGPMLPQVREWAVQAEGEERVAYGEVLRAWRSKGDSVLQDERNRTILEQGSAKEAVREALALKEAEDCIDGRKEFTGQFGKETKAALAESLGRSEVKGLEMALTNKVLGKMTGEDAATLETISKRIKADLDAFRSVVGVEDFAEVADAQFQSRETGTYLQALRRGVILNVADKHGFIEAVKAMGFSAEELKRLKDTKLSAQIRAATALDEDALDKDAKLTGEKDPATGKWKNGDKQLVQEWIDRREALAGRLENGEPLTPEDKRALAEHYVGMETHVYGDFHYNGLADFMYAEAPEMKTWALEKSDTYTRVFKDTKAVLIDHFAKQQEGSNGKLAAMEKKMGSSVFEKAVEKSALKATYDSLLYSDLVSVRALVTVSKKLKGVIVKLEKEKGQARREQLEEEKTRLTGDKEKLVAPIRAALLISEQLEEVTSKLGKVKDPARRQQLEVEKAELTRKLDTLVKETKLLSTMEQLFGSKRTKTFINSLNYEGLSNAEKKEVDARTKDIDRIAREITEGVKAFEKKAISGLPAEEKAALGKMLLGPRDVELFSKHLRKEALTDPEKEEIPGIIRNIKVGVQDIYGYMDSKTSRLVPSKIDRFLKRQQTDMVNRLAVRSTLRRAKIVGILPHELEERSDALNAEIAEKNKGISKISEDLATETDPTKTQKLANDRWRLAKDVELLEYDLYETGKEWEYVSMKEREERGLAETMTFQHIDDLEKEFPHLQQKYDVRKAREEARQKALNPLTVAANKMALKATRGNAYLDAAGADLFQETEAQLATMPKAAGRKMRRWKWAGRVGYASGFCLLVASMGMASPMLMLAGWGTIGGTKLVKYSLGRSAKLYHQSVYGGPVAKRLRMISGYSETVTSRQQGYANTVTPWKEWFVKGEHRRSLGYYSEGALKGKIYDKWYGTSLNQSDLTIPVYMRMQKHMLESLTMRNAAKFRRGLKSSRLPFGGFGKTAFERDYKEFSISGAYSLWVLPDVTATQRASYLNLRYSLTPELHWAQAPSDRLKMSPMRPTFVTDWSNMALGRAWEAGIYGPWQGPMWQGANSSMWGAIASGHFLPKMERPITAADIVMCAMRLDDGRPAPNLAGAALSSLPYADQKDTFQKKPKQAEKTEAGNRDEKLKNSVASLKAAYGRLEKEKKKLSYLNEELMKSKRRYERDRAAILNAPTTKEDLFKRGELGAHNSGTLATMIGELRTKAKDPNGVTPDALIESLKTQEEALYTKPTIDAAESAALTGITARRLALKNIFEKTLPNNAAKVANGELTLDKFTEGDALAPYRTMFNPIIESYRKRVEAQLKMLKPEPFSRDAEQRIAAAVAARASDPRYADIRDALSDRLKNDLRIMFPDAGLPQEEDVKANRELKAKLASLAVIESALEDMADGRSDMTVLVRGAPVRHSDKAGITYSHSLALLKKRVQFAAPLKITDTKGNSYVSTGPLSTGTLTTKDGRVIGFTESGGLDLAKGSERITISAERRVTHVQNEKFNGALQPDGKWHIYDNSTGDPVSEGEARFAIAKRGLEATRGGMERYFTKEIEPELEELKALKDGLEKKMLKPADAVKADYTISDAMGTKKLELTPFSIVVNDARVNDTAVQIEAELRKMPKTSVAEYKNGIISPSEADYRRKLGYELDSLIEKLTLSKGLLSENEYVRLGAIGKVTGKGMPLSESLQMSAGKDEADIKVTKVAGATNIEGLSLISQETHRRAASLAETSAAAEVAPFRHQLMEALEAEVKEYGKTFSIQLAEQKLPGHRRAAALDAEMNSRRQAGQAKIDAFCDSMRTDLQATMMNRAVAEALRNNGELPKGIELKMGRLAPIELEIQQGTERKTIEEQIFKNEAEIGKKREELREGEHDLAELADKRRMKFPPIQLTTEQIAEAMKKRDSAAQEVNDNLTLASSIRDQMAQDLRAGTTPVESLQEMAVLHNVKLDEAEETLAKVAHEVARYDRVLGTDEVKNLGLRIKDAREKGAEIIGRIPKKPPEGAAPPPPGPQARTQRPPGPGRAAPPPNAQQQAAPAPAAATAQRQAAQAAEARVESVGSYDEALAIVDKAEIHGTMEYMGQTLNADEFKALLKDPALLPRRKITIGDNAWFSSNAYDIDGTRIGVVAYVETEGKTVARSYYLSNSQGVWRYLPNYTMNPEDGGLRWYGKGYGEESVTLPIPAQKALSGLVELGVASVANPGLVFAGTSRPYKEPKRNVTYFGEVEAVPEHLSGNFYAASQGGKIAPEDVKFTDPGQAPDFSMPITGWKQKSSLYGDVKVEVFNSKDGRYSYMFCKDSQGRAWIGGIEDNASEIKSTGLRSKWVDGGSLATPAYEYNTLSADQTGGYGSDALRAGQHGEYADMFENYLSKIQVIKEYLSR